MNRLPFWSLWRAAALLLTLGLTATLGSRARAQRDPLLADADFGRLPLSFLENRGQADPSCAYYVQGADKSLFFGPGGMTCVPTEAAWDEKRPGPTSEDSPEVEALRRRCAVRLEFQGARRVGPVGEEVQLGVVSYFKGPKEDWKTGLRSFSRLRYRELWRGIDLAYTGDQQKVKYEFTVQPGVDPAEIRLRYDGPTDVRVLPTGELAVETRAGGYRDQVPFAYQEVDGRQVPVECAYDLRKVGERRWEYGFRLGAYDRSHPLIIDPELVVYAGFLGGSGIIASGITTDEQGAVYVCGEVNGSLTIPGRSHDATKSGAWDAYVAKVHPSGTHLEYAGYIGGDSTEWCTDVAVDGLGRAYVVGKTRSSQDSLPLHVGPDLTANGGDDAWVARVGATGINLDFFGFIGGSGSDDAYGVAVWEEHAIVVGSTSSPDFPILGGVGPRAGSVDGFVARLWHTGEHFDYIGCVGGGSLDVLTGVAADGSGAVYVVGYSNGAGATRPLTPAFQPGFGGAYDAIIGRLKAGGDGWDYMSYLGGAYYDFGSGIAVDGLGRAYVCGRTCSGPGQNFPIVRGPYSTKFHPAANRSEYQYYDGFVARVSWDGNSLEYCGYVGGAYSCLAVAVDRHNRAALLSRADNPNFDKQRITVRAFFPPHVISNSYNVCVVDPQGDGLEMAGSIHSGGATPAGSLVFDTHGDLYVTGSTRNWVQRLDPRMRGTVGPFLRGPVGSDSGDQDVFIARITRDPTLVAPVLSAAVELPATVNLTWTEPNRCEQRYEVQRKGSDGVWNVVDGYPAVEQSDGNPAANPPTPPDRRTVDWDRWTDTAAANQSYWYRVCVSNRIVGDVEQVVYSNELKVDLFPPPRLPGLPPPSPRRERCA